MADSNSLPQSYDTWKLSYPPSYNELEEEECPYCHGIKECVCDRLYDEKKDREIEERYEREDYD